MSSPEPGNGSSVAVAVSTSTRNRRSRKAGEGKRSGKVGLPVTGALTPPRQNLAAPCFPSRLSAVAPPWQSTASRAMT